ncbi:MAG: hypothetical protein A3K19_20905 [Lentisphaerae bacterium RIFOXYB12_FULL_65_16]|nr:MAG: hypothetical protein A3K18_19330 [Lentisphaerae bacterium RIFOXYA12_64_32]OGV85194.1 MAG: hypothetical protein A3K19_20905 [Lentisphaerae bacterium RIFOXYB12_FULL_65_16]
MLHDPIIAEVRRNAMKLQERAGNDFARYVRMLREKEKRSAATVVDLCPASSAYPDAASQPTRVVAESRPKYGVRSRTPTRATKRSKR